jgi:P27 family predicted phage terminase small subunit
MGLLAKTDRAALELYCQHYARWKQAELVVKEKGLIFKTPNGLLQRRPEVTIAANETAIVRGFLLEFGLTPASRSRIGIPGKQEEDAFSAYMQNKR